MLYWFLTYPLDVIKTNRIVNSFLAKEGAESIPREMMALMEKGGVQSGLYRGLLAGMVLTFARNQSREQTSNVLMFMPLYTVISNPIHCVMVHKQVVTGAHEAPSYTSILAKLNARIFTLGLIPSFIKNSILIGALLPSTKGVSDEASSVVLAAGAIIMSHPFEVARVEAQYSGEGLFGDFMGTLNARYARHGMAGLYTGLVPRMLYYFPGYMAVMAYSRSQNSEEYLNPLNFLNKKSAA